MPSSNRVVLATAGSGKTTTLVDEVLADRGRRVLVLSYTQENVNEIRKRIIHHLGWIPAHITVQGWFTFTLKEGVRPFQNYMYDGPRIDSMLFETPTEEWYKRIPKSNTKRYYFTSTGKIYRDRMSDFIVEVNKASGGRVVERICQMYDAVYIDEIQDLTGWDLELLDLLMSSPVRMVVAGDVRQAILSTTNSTKNKKFQGFGLVEYFKDRERKGKCDVELKSTTYRCVQLVADFADGLYPGIEQRTTSLNTQTTDHDGVYVIRAADVPEYVAWFKPQVLRYTKNQDGYWSNALNIGVAKGQTFDRVLINLQGPGHTYLETGLLSKTERGKVKPAFDIAKLYVAVTRARFSVAFVHDGTCALDGVRTYTPSQLPPLRTVAESTQAR